MTYSKSVFTIQGDFPAVGLLVDGHPYFDADTTKSLIKRHEANDSTCYWDDNRLVTFLVDSTNIFSWDGGPSVPPISLSECTQWCGFQQDDEWYYPLGIQWEWASVLDDCVDMFLDKLKSELSHANQYWEMRVQQTNGDKWAPDSFCDPNELLAEVWDHWFEHDPQRSESQRHADVLNLIGDNAAERLLIKGWQWEHPEWEFQTEFQRDVMPQLEDYSWHNDAMPCFCDDETGIMIWVDHLDPDKREYYQKQDVEQHDDVIYYVEQATGEAGEWEHGNDTLLRTSNVPEIKALLDDHRTNPGSSYRRFTGEE